MTDCILVSFPFCLQVSIIQPGNYARSTKIQPPVSAEEIWNELSEEEKAVYNKEYVQERANFFNSIVSEGSPNGNEVVDAMVDALVSPAPKARYMVARLKEKALVLVCALFPTAVMDFFLSYALSKVKLKQPALVSFSDSGQEIFLTAKAMAPRNAPRNHVMTPTDTNFGGSPCSELSLVRTEEHVGPQLKFTQLSSNCISLLEKEQGNLCYFRYCLENLMRLFLIQYQITVLQT